MGASRHIGREMPLVHGEDIGAAYIEREVSSWNADRFARLCNSIAWAVTWDGVQSLPVFTERVFVADGGIDAEWQGDLSGTSFGNGQFLSAGLNVFQYKKRDVAESARSKIVSDLCSDLKGAIADVERRTDKSLISYVFFTNVDLTPNHHHQLRNAVLVGADEQRVRVGIVGAGNVAAMLNGLPHLRSAFFATAAFRTWGESWDTHRHVEAFPEAPLIGRDQVVDKLKGWIADPTVCVIVLTGTHMMGKTRVALEATRDWDTGFVEALERQAPDIEALSRLESPGRTVIALINEPGFEFAQHLARAAVTREGLKLILCVSTAADAPTLGFGRDPRLRRLSLLPLDETDSQKLLRAANVKLDYSLESWVIDNAGGVPGVLLAAGHVGATLRLDGGSFLEQVAKEFEGEAQRRLGLVEFEALRPIALLLYLGVRGDVVSEALAVCSHFGIDANLVLNALDRLVASGFVRMDGAYAEVVPPPLANLLAAQLMRGRTATLQACFVSLPEPARRRLLRRLIQVDSQEARQFWDNLLGPGGPFTSIDGVIANSNLFSFAATVEGRKVGALLHRHLMAQSVEQRRQIQDDARRDIIHAIEEILFRTAANGIAFECLILLAEAESENWSSSASGLLKEAFAPLHPQIPLTLDRRLAVLENMLAPSASNTIALLAIEALSKTLALSSSTMLRRSTSVMPLGRIPEMTWDDAWNYLGECLVLLDVASKDHRVEICSRAAKLLPRALTSIISRAHSAGLPLLGSVIDRVLAGETIFDVHDLADAMKWCRHALRDNAHGGPQANAGAIEELSAFLTRLQGASFSIRMRLWVGGWAVDLDDTQNPTRKSDQAIIDLALEVCAQPDLLSDELVTWLRTDAQRAGQFWQALGRSDTTSVFTQRILALGARDDSAHAVVCYLSGWCERDPKAARAFFAAKARGNVLGPRTILACALNVELPDEGAVRIAQLLREGQIESRAIDPLTAGRWVQNVSELHFVDILGLVAGPDFEDGPQLPELMFPRFLNRTLEAGPLANFAWRYLEARPVLGRHLGDYYSDQLGCRLIRLDAARGLALLDRCIRDDRSGERWNPLTSMPALEFWKALSQLDRSGAVMTVLEAACNGGDTVRWSVMWQLPNVIDLATDTPMLIEFAARGEREALTACQAITGGRDGFWPVALGLIDLYATNQAVCGELEQRVRQMGQMIAGPFSEHSDRCRDDVEQARRLPGLSMRVRAWLDDLAGRLREEVEGQRRQEAENRVNRG